MPPQPPQPSVEDTQAVSAAVAQAAQDAPTPEQARSDAAAAAQRVGAEKGLKVSQEEANLIANAVVSAMEQRGAFDAPIEQVAPPPAAAPAGGGDVATAPPATAAATVEQPPRKRTFAQRFLGE